MLGKKKSLIDLKRYLIESKNISNISETQFCQGRTMRWALAWSIIANTKDNSEFVLPKFNYMKVKIHYFRTVGTILKFDFKYLKIRKKYQK